MVTNWNDMYEFIFRNNAAITINSIMKMQEGNVIGKHDYQRARLLYYNDQLIKTATLTFEVM